MGDKAGGVLAGAAAVLALLAGTAFPGAALRAVWLVQWPGAARSALVQAAAQRSDGLPVSGQAASADPVQDGSGDSGVLPAPAQSEAAAESTLLTPALPWYDLLGDDRRPTDAVTVVEKTYGHGSGDNYVPLAAGSIKNNTKVPAQTVAAAAAAGLPFAVELDSTQPQVLIMHTHATETYRLASGLWVEPGSSFRSTDREVDLCAVGAVMADTLNARGICTLQDVTLNDYPSYTGSYDNSRAVVQRYLEQYPSIKVVLDVHRDAIETNGSPVSAVTQVNGQTAAQVMIISGCDNGGSVKLPNYQKNLAFAAAWESAMESAYPGLTRPVLFSYRFYNQDLTTGSLLLEVGSHGNNLNEALYAGYLAADALAELFGA